MATGTSVDFVFPANHVEAVNGLVYVNGGGWTNLYRNVPPTLPTSTNSSEPMPIGSPMGIVVGLNVPWIELSKPHRVTVRIDSVPEDGEPTPVMRLEGLVTVGQQRFERADQSERVMLSYQAIALFPSAGPYRLVAQVDASGDSSNEGRTWEFWVHDMPASSGVAS